MSPFGQLEERDHNGLDLISKGCQGLEKGVGGTDCGHPSLQLRYANLCNRGIDDGCDEGVFGPSNRRGDFFNDIDGVRTLLTAELDIPLVAKIFQEANTDVQDIGRFTKGE
jgi:hypothetical protein